MKKYNLGYYLAGGIDPSELTHIAQTCVSSISTCDYGDASMERVVHKPSCKNPSWDFSDDAPSISDQIKKKLKE